MCAPSTTASAAPREIVTLGSPVTMVDIQNALDAVLTTQESPLWFPYFTIAGDNSAEASWSGGPSYVNYYVVTSCTEGANLLIAPHELVQFDLDGTYTVFEVRPGGPVARCRCLHHVERKVDVQTVLLQMAEAMKAQLAV